MDVKQPSCGQVPLGGGRTGRVDSIDTNMFCHLLCFVDGEASEDQRPFATTCRVKRVWF